MTKKVTPQASVKKTNPRARKVRVDSKESAVKAMQAGRHRIEPPSNVPLQNEDKAFFYNIIGEKANVDWTMHEIELAALLAKAMRDQVEETDALRVEGTILYNARGTPVMNPRRTAIGLHTSSIMSLRRSLAIHGSAGGSTQVTRKKGQQINKSNQSGTAMDDDDLIPRPSN